MMYHAYPLAHDGTPIAGVWEKNQKRTNVLTYVQTNEVSPRVRYLR